MRCRDRGRRRRWVRARTRPYGRRAPEHARTDGRGRRASADRQRARRRHSGSGRTPDRSGVMDAIRILIADDHELVRLALRTLLEAEGDLAVVGEACDTESAINEALALCPDVLLLDLRMPGSGGIDACRRIKAAAPEIAVLVITSFDDDEELFGALAAGANGYLMKDTRPDRIVNAVRSLHYGQAVFDAGIASRVISGRSGATSANDLLSEPLSERELDVLRLIARGHGNREIARELWIGESTVKTHVSHILRKLGKSDRTQAVIAALRAGVVKIETGDSEPEG